MGLFERTYVIAIVAALLKIEFWSHSTSNPSYSNAHAVRDARELLRLAGEE